jgi:DNA-binding MarR family transcriptional regulator
MMHAMAKTTWLTDEQHRAWRALVRMSQLVQLGVDRQLQRDAEMPHAYYAVLVALSEAPKRTLALTDLAGTLGYSLSRLSHSVTRMEEQGWVERRPCPTSKRVTFATLTSSGMAALRAAAPGHAAYVREVVLRGLTHRELAQLASIGAHVAEAVAAVTV